MFVFRFPFIFTNFFGMFKKNTLTIIKYPEPVINDDDL